MNELAQHLRSERGALAALGVCAFVVCMIGGTLIFVLFAFAEEQGAASLAALGRSQAQIAQGPAMQQSLLSLNRALQEQPGVVGGETQPLAAAKLDGDVKSLLQEAGADVRSSQILPAGKSKGFQTIAIEYEFNVPMEKFQALLYALQSHTPFLFADDVTISAADISDESPNKAPPLHVQFTLRAYRWAGHRW